MPETGASRSTPTGARAWAAQAALYGLFALAIGVFSQWPTYRHLQPDQALIKLSFVHSAKPAGECRRLTEHELSQLPPNMRAPVRCPRERSPITVELDIGGAPALRRTVQPSGLRRDGAAAVYEQRISVRLRDDPRPSGFGWQRDAVVALAPAQVLVIDFDAEKGGITLR
jgi:hypothetical protein